MISNYSFILFLSIYTLLGRHYTFRFSLCHSCCKSGCSFVISNCLRLSHFWDFNLKYIQVILFIIYDDQGFYFPLCCTIAFENQRLLLLLFLSLLRISFPYQIFSWILFQNFSFKLHVQISLFAHFLFHLLIFLLCLQEFPTPLYFTQNHFLLVFKKQLMIFLILMFFNPKFCCFELHFTIF